MPDLSDPEQSWVTAVYRFEFSCKTCPKLIKTTSLRVGSERLNPIERWATYILLHSQGSGSQARDAYSFTLLDNFPQLGYRPQPAPPRELMMDLILFTKESKREALESYAKPLSLTIELVSAT